MTMNVCLARIGVFKTVMTSLGPTLAAVDKATHWMEMDMDAMVSVHVPHVL